MSFYLMCTTLLSGAVGACTRFGCQRLGLGVWQINAVASVLVGVFLFFFNADRFVLVVLLGFLAGFSTVSGQVREVFEKYPTTKGRLGALIIYVVAGGLLAWVPFTLLQVLST